MGFLIFLALFFAMEIFVFRLLKTAFYGRGENPDRPVFQLFMKRIWFAVVYWGLTVAFFVNWGLQFYGIIHYSEVPFWIYINAFFFLLYIAKFASLLLGVLTELLLLGDRAINFFSGTSYFSPSRKRFLKITAAAFGLLPFTTLLYGMVRNPYRYTVYESDILIDDLPPGLENLKIVQISDIHAGSWVFQEPVGRAVDMINELEPDLVLFTGDLVNNIASEMEPFIPVFKKIKSRYGVYSVLGNHDYGDYFRWQSSEDKRANFQQLLDTHQAMGWKLLRNQSELVEIGEDQLAVIGVENYSALPQFPRYGDLDKAMAEVPESAFKILLTHDPTHWDAEIVNQNPDIGITFSGHTHGFQFGFEIPGVGRWSPGSMIYDQWAGLYKKGKQYLYVNRGLGYLGYPGRVGILPEISLLTLRRNTLL